MVRRLKAPSAQTLLDAVVDGRVRARMEVCLMGIFVELYYANIAPAAHVWSGNRSRG